MHPIYNIHNFVTNVQARGDINQSQSSTFHGLREPFSRAQSTNNAAGMIPDNDTSDTRRLKWLKERLQPRLIDNASYLLQDKRPCDSNTRQDILREIKLWIKDFSSESQCFYWLSGEPGVGKSAITVSTAQYCIDRKILGAQFFINRNDAATTDPCVFFPTICWQLCKRFPQVAVAMEKVLDTRPTLIDGVSEDQATKLFVKAIKAAAVTDPSKAVVVVVDALDETDHKRLWEFAQILSKMVTDLPRNAKVFISSRTENAITKPFNPLCRHARVKSRYLAAKESIEEVSRFMKKNVDEILRQYDINWADWGDDRMKKLSFQASGLYIWAETALKYLSTEIANSGTACVGELLDMLTTNGMDDINQLYLGILRRTCRSGDWEYKRFRHIIGAILVRQTSLSIRDIGQLLDLKDPVSSKPVDLLHFVRQYRTVLVNDTKEIDDDVVPRMHRSFADFIASERAHEFRIDKSASHKELALRCIDQLVHLVVYLKPPDKETQVSFPAQLIYASLHWRLHLMRMVEPDINNDVEEKNAYDILDVPENDTQSLQVNPHSKILDRAEIDRNGFWTVAFTPDGTQLALPSKHDVQIWDARTGSVAMTFTGHEDAVVGVGFSSDGTQLVSASDDHTARIWDIQTRRVLHVLHGNASIVDYGGISYDGRTMLTYSANAKTLHTWDLGTGQLIKIFKSHMAPVMYCAFSRDDQRIASYTSIGGEIMVWDVNSGNLICKFYHKGCRMILFCPCGGHLISCGWGREIKLWDTESGELLSHTNSTVARSVFVEDPEQESEQEFASTHIHVPPAVECIGSSTLLIYTLQTPSISVYGIVEHGQPESVWISGLNSLQLSFASGATRIDFLF